MSDAIPHDRTNTAPAPVPNEGTRTVGAGVLPSPDTATYPAAGAPHAHALPTPPHDRSTPFGPPGFDLLGKIAEGGMGVVHKARDRTVGRVVALKVLKLNVFDERSARQRFTREVQVMARVEHPNLVPVYQSGEHNGVPYFAMKYMPGGTLGAVRSRGPLPPRHAAELLRQIAAGVAAMHAAHILHRDLKPSNVLLDEHGVPHVADFGLVKWTDDDDHTQTGARNGTPQYMSPEQVAGRSRKLTAACDVWALGVIGYELVCGKRPFEHDDREDLYRAITHDRPADPCDVNPAVPAPLAAVLLACLNKDPLARYPSAAELAADLGRYLADESVAAEALPTVAHPPRGNRRTWLKVAAGAGGLAVVGGLGAAAVKLLSKEPTFGETVAVAFARRESVTLIGDTGGPRWSVPVPADAFVYPTPVFGTFTLEPNPNATKPLTNGWLDLLDTPLPGPYRFEAEVCYRKIHSEGGSAFVGVYLGRRTWDADGVLWQTAAVNCHQWDVSNRRPGVELCMMANPVKEQVHGGRIGITDEPPLPPPMPNPLDDWFTLAIELSGDVLAGQIDDVRFDIGAEDNGAGLRRRFRDKVKGSQPDPRTRPKHDPAPPVPAFDGPSLFGSALGLFVWDATVSVRRARLIPLPAPGA